MVVRVSFVLFSLSAAHDLKLCVLQGCALTAVPAASARTVSAAQLRPADGQVRPASSRHALTASHVKIWDIARDRTRVAVSRASTAGQVSLSAPKRDAGIASQPRERSVTTAMSLATMAAQRRVSSNRSQVASHGRFRRHGWLAQCRWMYSAAAVRSRRRALRLSWAWKSRRFASRARTASASTTRFENTRPLATSSCARSIQLRSVRCNRGARHAYAKRATVATSVKHVRTCNFSIARPPESLLGIVSCTPSASVAGRDRYNSRCLLPPLLLLLRIVLQNMRAWRIVRRRRDV